MPKWRNRQTRYVQGVVSFGLMRVQIPPSALAPQPVLGGLIFNPVSKSKNGTIVVTKPDED